MKFGNLNPKYFLYNEMIKTMVPGVVSGGRGGTLVPTFLI